MSFSLMQLPSFKKSGNRSSLVGGIAFAAVFATSVQMAYGMGACSSEFLKEYDSISVSQSLIPQTFEEDDSDGYQALLAEFELQKQKVLHLRASGICILKGVELNPLTDSKLSSALANLEKQISDLMPSVQYSIALAKLRDSAGIRFTKSPNYSRCQMKEMFDKSYYLARGKNLSVREVTQVLEEFERELNSIYNQYPQFSETQHAHHMSLYEFKCSDLLGWIRLHESLPDRKFFAYCHRDKASVLLNSKPTDLQHDFYYEEVDQETLDLMEHELNHGRPRRKNVIEVFQLESSASHELIRSQYLELSRMLHPDSKNRVESNLTFEAVNEVYHQYALVYGSGSVENRF